MVSALKEAGFQAYLVGGCVRDLVLGGWPKDFDIATDARPEQIRPLFRRARIIGKRFKLVHVRFGREVIEVATFRAGAHLSDEIEMTDKGRIVSDNVYGDMHDDAFRRDFTINALFYDPSDQIVLDYVGGYDDLKQRHLRVIGETEKSLREDPVRMLRAARFVAKLDLELIKELQQAIPRLAHLLRDISHARLFDEVVKLLQGGSAVKTMLQLCQLGLLQHLLPVLDVDKACQGVAEENTLLWHALENTDKRISIGKSVTPSFLFAALLWEPVRQLQEKLASEGQGPIAAMDIAGPMVIEREAPHVVIPKRFSVPMREIWTMQLRLSRRAGKRAFSLLNHPRFRAAYDFLLLREHVGQEQPELADWWTRFQEEDEAGRRAMVAALQPQRRKKGPPRKRRRRKANPPA